jgi:hypothetical protein
MNGIEVDTMRWTSVAVVSAVLLAGPAHAQEEPSRFRTSLSLVGGLSVGSEEGVGLEAGRLGPRERSDTGAAFGGGVARDLTPRLTLEANGFYLDRAAGAWSADLGFRLNLAPSSKSIVPYFGASGGLFSERSREATIGLGDGDAQPGVRGDAPNGARGPVGTTSRPMSAPPLEARGSRRTDAMVTMGGGALLAAGSHVFVRPDLRAQMVFSRQTRVLGLFTLNFGYRF